MVADFFVENFEKVGNHFRCNNPLNVMNSVDTEHTSKSVLNTMPNLQYYCNLIFHLHLIRSQSILISPPKTYSYHPKTHPKHITSTISAPFRDVYLCTKGGIVCCVSVCPSVRSRIHHVYCRNSLDLSLSKRNVKA